MSPEVKNYVFKEYIPARVKKKIFAHSIVTKTPENSDFKKQDKKHYRKTKIIEDPNFQFNFELNIYDDKASFIVFQENQYSSFIIQNKIIAEGLKSMHQNLWDNH